MDGAASLIFYVVAVPLHLWVALSVLSAERRRPAATLAWLLTVVFLPGLGALLYLVIGTTRARRLRRRTASNAETIAQVVDRFDARRHLREALGDELEARTESFLRLSGRLASMPASGGNAVRLLFGGAAAYRSMIEAVEAAEHSVHVLFYIIRSDRVGTSLRDRLAARARDGVEVRLIYDAVGSVDLPDGFWRPLIEAGGRVAPFNPVFGLLTRWRHRDRIDFRNHRKIVVVDGRVGFTGGINVGREYLGLDPDMGHWRDTHVRLEGPSVLALQEVFARDWLSATDEVVDDRAWFPAPPDETPGSSVVQVVDSGPESPWAPLTQLYAQALASARRRAWLTTPYFVPNESIEEALVSAALRGVDVRLLLPGRSDSLLVGLASRSYYPPMLEAGVRLYEYQRGFVHAKSLVIDDWLGTVGSANMDMRSFLLNFELNAFVLDRDFCDTLAQQFVVDLGHARQVTENDPHARSYPRRLLYQTARLTSPLL